MADHVMAATHGGSRGVWLIFAWLLLFGIVLIVNGAASGATRRLRGRDAAIGQVRGMERMAGASMRVGAVMATVGALGFGCWWVFVR